MRTVLNEKWKNDVEIERTGKHANKTIAQLQQEVSDFKDRQKKYKKKNGKANPKLTSEIKERQFAIRAKRHFSKKPVNESLFEVSQPIEIVLDGQRYLLEVGDKIRINP